MIIVNEVALSLLLTSYFLLLVPFSYSHHNDNLLLFRFRFLYLLIFHWAFVCFLSYEMKAKVFLIVDVNAIKNMQIAFNRKNKFSFSLISFFFRFAEVNCQFAQSQR